MVLKVHGLEIPQALIDEANAMCLSSSGFSSTILCALINRKMPSACADRVADRILQNLKKAGKIEFSGGLWGAVKL